MFIARSTPAYIVAYLVLMVPTYILPYFGSNSTLVNAFSAALGMGPTPQWWAHVWCLIMLTVLGWLRGKVIGKTYLPVFPVLAAVFDLTPGLSAIPMVPTFLHLAGIIVGAMGAATVAVDEAGRNVESVLMRKAGATAGAATLLAIGGSILFAITMSQAGKSLRGPGELSEAKVLPNSILPDRQQQNANQSNAQANNRSMPSTTPSQASAEANTIAKTTPEITHAAAAEPRKASSRTTRAPSYTKTAERKSANQEKPNVRYINLGD